jgi:hypothetical protein
MIAYCFHSVDGYSKVGSYTGNGSTDGTFVYTGFRPKYFMIKRTDAAASWWISDTERSPYNVSTKAIDAQSSGAEQDQYWAKTDFLSNGFKFREVNGNWNGSGYSYIFIAFAESPFKHTNAR